MNNAPDNKPPVNYEQKIAEQQEVVGRLVEEYAKKPSEDLKLQLKRRTDTLFHLRNLAKPEPKERAQQAAEKARLSALDNAITRAAG